MNYKYLDRPPVVGDLVIWDHRGSPTYVKLNTPYIVLRVTDTLVHIRDMYGNLTSLGSRGRKVLDTTPGKSWKPGDTVMCIANPSRLSTRSVGSVYTNVQASGNALMYKPGTSTSTPQEFVVIKTHNTHPNTEPQPEPEMNDPLLSQPKQRYRVFNSNGDINHKGLIYQELGHSSTDNRPFVQDLIKSEVERVLSLIRRTNFKKQLVKHSPKCDIKLLTLIQELHNFKSSDHITSQGALIATRKYYEYKKLSAAKVDHSWINSYLTKENLHSVDTITLFESNTRKLYIRSGIIEYYEDRVKYSMPIQYNEATKKFFI